MILAAFRGKDKFKDDYNASYLRADKAANKAMPNEEKKRKMTAEEILELNEEMKVSRKLFLIIECYLVLLRDKR